MRWALAFSDCCWLLTFRRHCCWPHNQKTDCNQNWERVKRSTAGLVAVGGGGVTKAVQSQWAAGLRGHKGSDNTSSADALQHLKGALWINWALKKLKNSMSIRLFQTNYANHSFASTAGKFLDICTLANKRDISLLKTPTGSLLMFLCWCAFSDSSNEIYLNLQAVTWVPSCLETLNECMKE